MNKAKTLEFIKKYAMIIVLIVVTAFFAWKTQGALLSPMSISLMISQNAYVFILATGMLLCILTGGNIDLSVGSVVCFVGAVGAYIMVNMKVNMWAGILIMLLLGTLIGSFQGVWIAYVRIPPFIVTLAGMLAFRGLSNLILDGKTLVIKDDCPAFVDLFGGGATGFVPDFFGNTSINVTCVLAGVIAAGIYVFIQFKGRATKIKKGYEVEKFSGMMIRSVIITVLILALSISLAMHKGIPSNLILIVVVILFYGYITSNTTIGRYFYAVGGNEKATKLSGINTNRVYFLAYANMGLLSALAAMVMLARLGGAQPSTGDGFEMDAIGSCFIGGASAYGGIGTVPGVIIGAILMGIINMGMIMVGVEQDWKNVVKGLVLLAAVIFDVVSKRGGKLMAKN